MTRRKLFISLGIFLLSAAFFLGGIAIKNFYEKISEEKKKRAAWNKLEVDILQKISRFDLEAGIVIEDLSGGWRICINEDKLFPSASLVKIPIMAGLISGAANGEVNLQNTLVLKNKTKVSGSGILKNYASGTKLKIEDLIEIMIVNSDNTATNMFLEYLGFDFFMRYFKKMSLHNTNIVRMMMDFKSRNKGIENFTTAADMACLLEAFYRNDFINPEFSLKCLDILKKQKLKDRIPAMLPESTVVAHKTGLERGVCHDAGIVLTDKGDFLICVLTRHNYKVSRNAKRCIALIAREVYDYYYRE